MSNYRVIVGNIGTVIDNADARQMKDVFSEYVKQSRDGYGRAAYETVTAMKGDEIVKEFRPKLRVPSIAELASLIVHIKKHGIDDDFRAYEDDEEPGILLTIGCSYDKDWDYQTGDNSYTGGAYGHPFWGVGSIYRNSNSRELAKEIINDVHEQTY